MAALDEDPFGAVPPFTVTSLIEAWREACVKEWDIPDPVTGVRGEPSAVLPEGVLPQVAEMINPVTRSVVEVERLPMFPRQRPPQPVLVLAEPTPEQAAEFREQFTEAMVKPWRYGCIPAAQPVSALTRVTALAKAQRMNAEQLRDAVTAAHEAGASWSELERATGMIRETLFRQVKAGSPVVVVKASHKTGSDD